MDSDPQPQAPEPHADLDVDAEQERLDDLGHRIEQTRHQAEQDLHPGSHERSFADSGAVREQDDDQTIAPPG